MMRSALLVGGAMALWAAGGANPASAASMAASCPATATEALEIRGSTLCIAMGDPGPGRREVLHVWAERSARIVAQYYGRFPAAVVLVDLAETEGDGVGGGRTTNDGGLVIRVSVGKNATAERLAKDWVLVHEMIHLALPEVGRSHNWLAEGLAVYVEGVARAQFGNRDVADVWAEDRHSMPMGLPREGEGGMDQTSTWARTYWGGALFCLEAEVTIREKTHNRLGLQTALRAILSKTGGYSSERELSSVLKIGDEATGTRVLEDLYDESRHAPRAPDLNLLWARLGVPDDPRTQPFDDHAPLAAIRLAITAPPSAHAGSRLTDGS
jgi:hypothetical protein